MKKLMMAVAIVCAAVGVQAASYDWSGSIEIVDWNTDPETGASGTVQFFINGAAQDILSFSSGVAEFEGYTLDTGSSGDQDVLIKAIATVNNFADGTGTKEWEFTFNEAYVATKPTPADALDGMTGSANAWFDAESTGINFASTAEANGYTAVPEPTSGLLLLLGVAGMALRRRRA